MTHTQENNQPVEAKPTNDSDIRIGRQNLCNAIINMSEKIEERWTKDEKQKQPKNR